MSLDITISNESLRYLNAQAAAEAKTRIENYAHSLLEEAGRLEKTSGGSSADPQITSTMIKDADLLLRRGYRQARGSIWLIAGKIISPLGGLTVGFFADPNKLSNPFTLIVFVVLLIITVTATVLTVVKE